ncbi:MAG: hypothetical protein FWF34_01775 [Alphaproteobacteria bacterium]|nr:hypothetical protein [Alphaproteobacteria bacterium]MCL2889963.1 hypothetical protein [Alphaproteobacteria bacterium]
MNKKIKLADGGATTMHGPAHHTTATPIIDMLRNSWFLIVFIGTAIYWVARHDSNMDNVRSIDARTTILENRTANLESGIAQLQLRLDVIKEDITIIKKAVIK